MTEIPDDAALAAIDPAATPTGDEWTLLTGFLDYYRLVLARKAAGLNRDQLAATLGPSDLTIGGLVKTMTKVEDVWFSVRLLGEPQIEPFASVDPDADPDWDFRSAADDAPDELLAAYVATCERCRANISAVGDLDALTAAPSRRGTTFTLRWLMIHMIEEYARHVGHADLIRQSIDGATGD